MKIIAIGVGAALEVGAFVYMILLIVTAPAPDSTGFLTTVLCSGDETMISIPGERFEPGFFRINKVPHQLFCQDTDGTTRDVTGQAFAVVMGGYFAMFIPGLLIFLFGILSLVRERQLANDPRKSKRKSKEMD